MMALPNPKKSQEIAPVSMDWFVGEHLNRKTIGFSH
jgi:hypothetical protein